jgi:hypothetical protein
MGGRQCSDFGATPAGVEGLCRMGSGDYQGIVTYTDGRVAAVTEGNDDQPEGFYVQPAPSDGNRTPIRLDVSEDVIRRMRELQGVEFGDCSATGAMSSVSSVGFLETVSGGSPITWSAEDLRELYRALGQQDGQSANAFICSDQPNYGRFAVNNDGAHMASVLGAIETFESSCGSLDREGAEGHCEAMLESLRIAAHQDEPDSIWDQGWNIVGYLVGGIAVFVAGGFGTHLLTEWWNNRGGRGGGGDGGGGMSAFERGMIQGYQAGQRAQQAQAEGSIVESASERQGFWASVAIACGTGAAILWGDDATIIGAADDPLAAAVTAVAGIALFISYISDENPGGASGPQA